jgi:hypothetical protein
MPGNRSANSVMAKPRDFLVEYVSTYSISLSGKTSVISWNFTIQEHVFEEAELCCQHSELFID